MQETETKIKKTILGDINSPIETKNTIDTKSRDSKKRENSKK